jgi:hypothetical protein
LWNVVAQLIRRSIINPAIRGRFSSPVISSPIQNFPISIFAFQRCNSNSICMSVVNIICDVVVVEDLDIRLPTLQSGLKVLSTSSSLKTSIFAYQRCNPASNRQCNRTSSSSHHALNIDVRRPTFYFFILSNNKV